MGVNVYIKNSVFQESQQTMKGELDKSIDGISGMCISVIEELFQGIGNFPKDVPVFFGSAYSSTSSLHQFNKVCESAGALHVNPSFFPNTVLNAPFCRASIYHHITSPIFNICQGKASAMAALMLAYNHMLHEGIHQTIVCVAEEACDFVNKVEGKQQLSSCGALYLTDIEGDLKIVGFKNIQNKGIDKSYEPYGSTNLIYRIHNFLRTMSLDLGAKDNIISIKNGRQKLILTKYKNISETRLVKNHIS